MSAPDAPYIGHTGKPLAAVFCEYSGEMRRRVAALGYECWSFDFEPSYDDSPYHVRGDCLPYLDSYDWVVKLAHPPCTFLTNSGVTWLHRPDKYPNRWHDMREGAAFFRRFLDSWQPGQTVIVENPIMHGYALEAIGRRATCFTQPHHHGVPETKATGFWTVGPSGAELPPLEKTQPLEKPAEGWFQRLHYLPPSPDRWKLRSQTYPCIADAVVGQWVPPVDM